MPSIFASKRAAKRSTSSHDSDFALAHSVRNVPSLRISLVAVSKMISRIAGDPLEGVLDDLPQLVAGILCKFPPQPAQCIRKETAEEFAVKNMVPFLFCHGIVIKILSDDRTCRSFDDCPRKSKVIFGKYDAGSRHAALHDCLGRPGGFCRRFK